MKAIKIFVLLVALLQCGFVVAQSSGTANYEKKLLNEVNKIKADRAEIYKKLKTLKKPTEERARYEREYNGSAFALGNKYKELVDSTIRDMQRGSLLTKRKEVYAANLEKVKIYQDSMLHYCAAMSGMYASTIEEIKFWNNVYNCFVQSSEDLLSQMDGLTGRNLLNEMNFATDREKFEYACELIMLAVDKIKVSIANNYELSPAEVKLYRNYFSAMEYLRGLNDEHLKADRFQYSFDLFDIATERADVRSKYLDYTGEPNFDFFYLDLIRDCRKQRTEKEIKYPSVAKRRFKELRNLDEERLKNSPLVKLLIEDIILKGYWSNVWEIPSDAIKRAKKTNNPMFLFNYLR